ncbi:hypothetical protein F5X71_20270 [Nocardia brasiliensis]|uniref:Secreted protein n=1 Tax=Nocardia brasiliensis TaxID=37326 RepID=A0A6G9XTR4_NOCBR|nr:hypothetical protein [Nocardia brasiliensis]QIS04351.1 hypothetical protein F5X71_20270 [Nocardia brasiliensis]
MKRIAKTCAGLFSVAAALPIVFAATAHAAPPGSVYFNYKGTNCAITPDGAIGCDLPNIRPVGLTIVGDFSIPVPAPQIVADPRTRPGYDLSKPYTQPGGNSDFYQVANDQGTFGARISYAGASCEESFRGTFMCVSKGGYENNRQGVFGL